MSKPIAINCFDDDKFVSVLRHIDSIHSILCYCVYHYMLYVNTASMCMYVGVQYEEGAVIEPNCTTRCICQNASFDCMEQICTADGSTCHISGYGHYQTFDMNHFDFQGSCEYVLSKPCNSSAFIITVGNSKHDSFVAFIRIIIPNISLEILLGRNKQGGNVMIDDITHIVNEDKVVLQTDDVKVIRIQGNFYVVLIKHRIEIFWNGLYHVAVTADSTWENRMCGLCGNYNNDLSDDFKVPNGNVTSVANEFGSSWLFSNNSLSCDVTPFLNSCQASDVINARAKCNELLNNVFNVCNNAVDPEPYIDNCVFDYCSCNKTEREDCYCNSLATYAAVCAANRIVIPNWREAFCRK